MSKKTDLRYILKHNPTGFYVTGVDTFTDNISKAKLYEVNKDHRPTEWHDKMATNEYTVIARTETITVNFEEVPF